MTHSTSDIVKGTLFALLATILWAGNYVVAPELAKTLAPAELTFWRWFICVFALLLFFGKELVANLTAIKQHLGYIAFTSLLGVTLFIYCIYQAASSPNAVAVKLALIATTFPVITAIIRAIRDKTLPSINMVLGTIIVFFGIIMVVTNNNPSMLLQQKIDSADLWMLAAASAFSGYNVMMDKQYLPHNIGNNAFILSLFICGMLWLTPLYLYEIAQSANQLDITNITAKTLWGLLYIGIFASALAFTLWAKSSQYLSLETKGYIYYTIPISSALLDWLFIGQPPNLWDGLSFALIVLGIIVALGQFNNMIKSNNKR